MCLTSRVRNVLFAAMAAVAAAAVVSAGSGVPASARPVAAAAARQAAATGREQSRSELLINGDRLEVIGGKARDVAVVPAGTGFAASLTELRLAGKAYAIPDAALSYLGRGLDISLFDVKALPGNDTLPVRVAYRGAAPRLPGITMTSAADGVAHGYLTAAGARAFGAALVRQLAADHARGSHGPDGLFANGVSISLAGAVTAPGPRPLFPMHTLTVHGTALNGKPDTGGLVYVVNSDNFAFFGDPNEALSFFDAGTAKFSVPSGHYWALGDFTDFDSHGNPVSERMVVLPRFSVSGRASVSIDERAATSQVTVATPRPAAIQTLSWELRRTDNLPGDFWDWTWQYYGAFRLWVSPTTQPPAAGGQQVFASARLVSPATEKTPYTYDVAFEDLSGLIAKQQHYTVDPASLATVHARFYSGVPSAAAMARVGLFPLQAQDAERSSAFALAVVPLNVPVQQVEYVTAGKPPVYWLTEYWQSDQLDGGQLEATRTFRPGEDTDEDWNAYPLHTALNVNQLGAANVNMLGPGLAYGHSTLLSASRSGDILSLDVTPFSDSTPGHTGSGLNSASVSGTYEVDQNGTKIASGDAVKLTSPVGDFFTQVKLSPDPSRVRFVLNASRTGAQYPLSTATRTAWTWASRHERGGTIPQGWVCGDGSRSCSPEPLLTLDYAVAGLGLHGRAPAGAQVLRVETGHQQLAAGPKITSVTVQVSFDDGVTWRPAQVVGTGDTRYAVFSAPPASYVSLKVTAADAAGGTIAETITRGYATAAAASAGYKAACAAPVTGHARCLTLYSPQTATTRARAAGFTAAVAAPAGWGAKDIEAAYKLPVSKNPRQTVAVVDAYDTPNLESYLNTYRKEYGLPPCTTANGCFRKVNQDGKAAPLPANGTLSGWDLETTLDVDMVSAACPRCRILVVEANTASFADLAAAEDAAAKLGAMAISNSYGARENGFTQAYAGAYNHPGHAVVASSGDYGYTAASFPANLATVTAVGGTQLSGAPNGRGYTEQVWNTPGAGAGSSGCSAYVSKPSWQHDPHCPGRTVADVSALAWDIAIYNKDYGGWIEAGGTSASSPLIAGVYGLAGNAAKIEPGYEYTHAGSLFDITVGNNDWLSAEGGRPAVTITCASPRTATTRPPVSARPTGREASEMNARLHDD